MELRKNYASNSQTFHNFYPYNNKNIKNFNSNFTNNFSKKNNLLFPRHKNTDIITPSNNSNTNNNNSRSNGKSSENMFPVPNDFLNNARRTNVFPKFTLNNTPFCSCVQHKFSTNNLSLHLNKSNGNNSNGGFNYKLHCTKHSCEDVQKNLKKANLTNEKYYSDFLNNICDNEFRRKSILVKDKNTNDNFNNIAIRKNKPKRVSFFKPVKMEITRHYKRKQSVLLKKSRNNLLTNIHIIDNKSGNSPMSTLREQQKYIGENFQKEYDNTQKNQRLKFVEDSDREEPRNNISSVNNIHDVASHANRNRSKGKKNSTVVKRKKDKEKEKEKEKEKKKSKTRKDKKSKNKNTKNDDKENKNNKKNKSENKKTKKSNNFCLFRCAFCG